MKSFPALPLIACGPFLLQSMLAHGQQVPERTGVTGAVRQDTTGTVPGRRSDFLQIGGDVYAAERVTTNADGRTQILFLDGGRLFVFPDSEVIINRYHYDPKSGTGQLSVTLARGDMRAISSNFARAGFPGPSETTAAAFPPAGPASPPGQVAQGRLPAATQGHPAASTSPEAGGGLPSVSPGHFTTMNVQLQNGLSVNLTPSTPAPMIADMATTPGGGTRITSMAGPVEVYTLRSGSVAINRPGYAIDLSPSGVLSAPVRVSPDIIAGSQARLEGRTGGSGQRASAGTLGAFAHENSSLPASALLPSTRPGSLAGIDPGYPDTLAGFDPMQLGSFRQQVYVTNTVNLRLQGLLLGLLPATVTVTTPTTTRTVTFTLSPQGNLSSIPAGVTPESLIALGRPASVTVLNSSGSHSFPIPR